MASLYTKVKLYLETNSKSWEDEKENILLQNDSDSKGDYIASWNVDGLSKPTDSQLSSFETAGNTAESNAVIDAKRKAEYLSWEEQLDYIYHNGITKWKTDHIKPIKDKYPKE